MLKIDEYKKAKKELKSINENQNKTGEKFREEKSKIRERYYKLKRSLEDKEYKETEKLNKEADKVYNNFEDKKKDKIPITEEFKRILEIMEVIEEHKSKGVVEGEVYKYDYIYNDGGSIASQDKVRIFYHPIGVLADDKFKKIFVYITENRKPKNKYSLVAVGNSIFNENIIKIPYGYGIDAHTDNANIKANIKDLSNKEDLKHYFERNRNRILKEFLEKHKEAETLYKEVEAETENNKEWKIAHLEKQKYYYKNNVSHGTETDEYKQIIKELESLGVKK